MSNSLFQSSQDYCALIRRLNDTSPGYKGLDDFVNIKKDTCDMSKRPKIHDPYSQHK